MDEQLKNKLKILFHTMDSWKIFTEYLEFEEDKLLNTNRNVIEDRELRINQGKLQLIHSMKSLRSTIRDL